MNIATIIGARPQFVKAAVVSRAISHHKKIREIIIHTGQHHDPFMSDVFFEEMNIPKPNHNLEISGLSHGAMTGRMLEKIEEILVETKPDWVLVYGDTNSTLAGALAACKLHIPVAHVEAGLRSFNKKMPEEINRILTDKISSLLFCPSDAAMKNLQNEGITSGLLRTGDVMADAFLYYRTLAPKMAKIFSVIPEGNFSLATLHRAENTDDVGRLESILKALESISLEVPVYLPLHPRTRQKLKSTSKYSNIHFLDPLGYFDMLQLLLNCSLVLTDSGGLQKEAYLANKPCITFRDETEWVELTEAGVNKVVGSSTSSIIEATKYFLANPPKFQQGLYGDGNSAHKIIESMLNFRT